MILDWVSGRKPDHPMATIRAARELVAELPTHDSHKALEEITSWLDSIINTEGFKLDYRLGLADVLDRAGKNHHQKLALEYLGAPRLQKFHEHRLWGVSFEFWKTLGATYLQCIEQFQAGVPDSDKIRKELPVAAARTLRALTLQVKWGLQRYAAIEDRIWKDLARVYLFAESQGFAAHRTAVYPGPHGESSVEEEFLKTLMLAVSAPGSLAPIGIHIAERTVAHLGKAFVIKPKAALHCNFFFDLSMHKPPARVHKGMAFGPMVRFFGAGEAEQALRDLMERIKERDGVPSDVPLGGDFDKETVLSVCSHLEQYWAGTPAERNVQRRELATRLTVVHGFPQIVGWIGAVMKTSALEYTDREGAESWIVFDASDGGYGALLPQVSGDWLQVGGLLGLRSETESACRVGIVRRIARDRHGQRRVGIQVLGKVAIPVALSPSSGSRREAAHKGQAALLLSDKPDKNGEVALLMGAGSFTQKQDIHMCVRDRTYLLSPSALVEGEEEFDWARFRALKQL